MFRWKLNIKEAAISRVRVTLLWRARMRLSLRVRELKVIALVVMFKASSLGKSKVENFSI
jgi:hypothetical protein